MELSPPLQQDGLSWPTMCHAVSRTTCLIVINCRYEWVKMIESVQCFILYVHISYSTVFPNLGVWVVDPMLESKKGWAVSLGPWVLPRWLILNYLTEDNCKLCTWRYLLESHNITLPTGGQKAWSCRCYWKHMLTYIHMSAVLLLIERIVMILKELFGEI
jgi:hypothetical protein